MMRRFPFRRLWRLSLVLMLVLGLVGLIAPQPQTQAQTDTYRAPVVVLTVEGAVSPAMSDYIRRNLDDAAERRSPLVVLKMDTPGGLDSSMREIIRAILASPVPVATWVAPSGARAASAGTYILYASHVAAMAPATNLGAATPVAIGGGGGGGDDSSPFPFGGSGSSEEERAEETDGDGAETPSEAPADTPASPEGGEPTAEDAPADAPVTREAARDPGGDSEPRAPRNAMEAKAINDAVAYIRGLAELRGRNADWAEAAVRAAVSLSSREAAEMNVIDFVATDISDLLQQADGRTVAMETGEITLETAGMAVENIEPDWRTQLLAAITNPNVALILMLVGVYGIIFEFLNPGVLVPGTLGGISLILGLYSLALLPLNYAGIGLILLGLALIVAEAFAPSFGILGIGGTVALVLGVVMLVDTDVPGLDISIPLVAGVAVSGVLATFIVAYLARRSFGARVVSGAEEMVGAPGKITDWTGGEGHVWVHGERWAASGAAGLAPGDKVRVTALDGLTLRVERAG